MTTTKIRSVELSIGRGRSNVVLGIDPASACGWAQVEFPSGRLLNRGVWKLQHGRLEGGGMMFVRLETWLLEVTAQHPDIIAMEDVRRHIGTHAAHLYGGITATICRICEEIGATYTSVPVGTWKKLATGKGNASKEDVMKAAIARWGETSPWQQDEADAAFIGLTAGVQLGWFDGSDCGL